jgi:hypothetical protein
VHSTSSSQDWLSRQRHPPMFILHLGWHCGTYHAVGLHPTGDKAGGASTSGKAGDAAEDEDTDGSRKILAFAGTARRLDGKPITTPSQPVAVELNKKHGERPAGFVSCHSCVSCWAGVLHVVLPL